MRVFSNPILSLTFFRLFNFFAFTIWKSQKELKPGDDLILLAVQQILYQNADDDIGRAKMISSGGLYERGFKRVDANGDGHVTPEELQAISQ